MKRGILFALAIYSLVFSVSGAQVAWTLKLAEEPVADIAIAADHSIRAVTVGGKIFSIGRNGKINWTTSENEVDPKGICVDGSGFTYIGGRQFLSLNESGKVRWRMKLPSDAKYSAPVHARGRLYLRTANGIKKIEPAGEVLWNAPGDWANIGGPTIAENGRVMAAKDFGKGGPSITMLSESGEMIWNFPLPQLMHREPLLVLGEDAWFATPSRLYRLNGMNGALRSSFKTVNQFRTGPVALGDDRLVLGLSQGGARCYDLDGNVLWEKNLIPGSDRYLAVLNKDSVLVPTGDYLYNIDRNGNVLWKLPLPRGSAGPVASSERIYFGDISGQITAIDSKRP